MVLLYTGNELMAEIRRENGPGNQNRAMPMQLRDSREDGRDFFNSDITQSILRMDISDDSCSFY